MVKRLGHRHDRILMDFPQRGDTIFNGTLTFILLSSDLRITGDKVATLLNLPIQTVSETDIFLQAAVYSRFCLQ